MRDFGGKLVRHRCPLQNQTIDARADENMASMNNFIKVPHVSNVHCQSNVYGMKLAHGCKWWELSEQRTTHTDRTNGVKELRWIIERPRPRWPRLTNDLFVSRFDAGNFTFKGSQTNETSKSCMQWKGLHSTGIWLKWHQMNVRAQSVQAANEGFYTDHKSIHLRKLL